MKLTEYSKPKDISSGMHGMVKKANFSRILTLQQKLALLISECVVPFLILQNRNPMRLLQPSNISFVVDNGYFDEVE